MDILLWQTIDCNKIKCLRNFGRIDLCQFLVKVIFKIPTRPLKIKRILTQRLKHLMKNGRKWISILMGKSSGKMKSYSLVKKICQRKSKFFVCQLIIFKKKKKRKKYKIKYLKKGKKYIFVYYWPFYVWVFLLLSFLSEVFRKLIQLFKAKSSLKEILKKIMFTISDILSIQKWTTH